MAFPARKVFGSFEKRASLSRKSRELEWFRNLPQLHFDHVSYGFLSLQYFLLEKDLRLSTHQVYYKTTRR